LVYLFENQFVIQINQCHLSIGTDDKGLGYNVSRRNIVKDIARVGNGTALFTFFEQEVGENVIRQLRDALRPSWTGKLRYELRENQSTYISIFKKYRHQTGMGRIRRRSVGNGAAVAPISSNYFKVNNCHSKPTICFLIIRRSLPCSVAIIWWSTVC